MKIAPGRGRLSYEVAFQRPAFEIGANPAATLHVLHAAFSDQFALSLQNMSTNGGPPLSAAHYEVSLLDGAASVRVALDRYKVELNLLSQPTTDDTALAVGLANRVSQAVSQLASSVVWQSANVGVALWYRVDGDLGAWLQAHTAASNSALTQALGAEVAEHTLNARVRNNSQRWSASFLAEPSRVPPWDLFVNYNGIYIDGGMYETVETRAAHIDDLFSSLYDQWGLESVALADLVTP